MATVIKPKRGTGAPGSGDLAQYEIAIDTTNHKLYYSPDGSTNELLSGSTDIVEDTTPQLGGDLDVNDNAIVNNGSDSYFLIGADTELTGGDLFSTGNLTGAINVSTATPDNSNLTVTGGRSGKVTLTQDIGTGGSNSERVRFNYDEAIIDPAGYDLTTSSNGRGFQGKFNNIKINQSDSGNTSDVGTITGQFSYVNQGSIDGTLNIDRLNGVMAGIFINDSDVTIGDVKGFAYERYSSFANLTGTEYSFYSGVSGAELYNAGPATLSGLSYPTSDGTQDQVLVTDGAGNLSFADAPASVSSIDDLDDVDTTTTAPTTGQVLEWDGSNFVPGDNISEVIDDTTPQLGGDLDVDDNKITNDGSNDYFILGDTPSSDLTYMFSSTRSYGPMMVTLSEDIGATHQDRWYSNQRISQAKLDGDWINTNARYRCNLDEAWLDLNGFDTYNAVGDENSFYRSFNGRYLETVITNTSATASEIGRVHGDFKTVETGEYKNHQGAITILGDVIGDTVNIDMTTGGGDGAVTVEGDIIGYYYVNGGTGNTHNGNHFCFFGGDGDLRVDNGDARIKGFMEVNDGMLLEGDLELDGNIDMVGSQIGIGDNLTIDSFGGINAGSLNANADSNFSMSVGTGYQFQFQADGRDLAYYKEGEIELLTGLRLGNCTTGATDPSSATEGDLFINTSDSTLKRYNGTTWDGIITDAGTTVFSTTDNTIVFYNGSGWRKVTDSAL